MEEMNFEQEINLIKQRNKRVELDKSWETSWTRKICIAILTYIVVVAYTYITSQFSIIWLSSLVPVIGFILSSFAFALLSYFLSWLFS